MPSLADSQARFITCLQKGPEAFPDHLFVQDKARALLGLKAHANTISHARLVALENSYPRLRCHIGHESFHAISRKYIAQDHIWSHDINDLGAQFADFLASHADPPDGGTADEPLVIDRSAVDLAHIEWAWLESYRAAEAPALTLADIISLDEAQLLALPIAAHPAMRLVALGAPLSPQLSELGDHQPAALLIARPEAEILLYPLPPLTHQLAANIENIATMGNLLAAAIELTSEDMAMAHLIKLVQIGALMKRHELEQRMT